MDDFIKLIKNIIDRNEEDIFYNSQRINALLMDLIPDQKRNRLLARHFIEAGGFSMLKRNDNALIIRRLREDFSIEANAAAWILNVFSDAMGLSRTDDSKQETAVKAGADGSSAVLDFAVKNESAVAIGMRHTAAVLKDGTVAAHGDNDFLQCDVAAWRSVISVAAGDAHTVGLLEDGRVLASGRNDFDQCNVAGYENIASIYAFGSDTICVRQDGTVVSCGKSHLDLSHFEQIRAVAWHPEGVYGIRRDGRVMMSSAGWEEEDWILGLTEAVQIISTYVDGSFVLNADGRIYKMNEPDSYFAQLRDIIDIVDLNGGFAVLRADGTVRILPYDRTTPRIASKADKWQEITAIYGKYKRLMGLTSEGRLLAECTDPDWLKRNGNLDFIKNWFPVGPSPVGPSPIGLRPVDNPAKPTNGENIKS